MKRKLLKSVHKIVVDYLKANGYDGLYCYDAECGCVLDDLAPCCDYICACEPAYNHETNPTKPFRMSTRKPRSKRNAP